MPRTARASAGNLIYHVLNRGNGRAAVFHSEGDYAAFVRLIADAQPRADAGPGRLPDAQSLPPGALANGRRRSVALDGQVIERFIYDAYGRRTVLDPNWSFDADNLSDVGFGWGHQGGLHDLLAGLVHFRFRWLDTSLGRWNRQDPLGFIDGTNLFLAYVANATNLRDLLGLMTICRDCGLDGGSDEDSGSGKTGNAGNARCCDGKDDEALEDLEKAGEIYDTILSETQRLIDLIQAGADDIQLDPIKRRIEALKATLKGTAYGAVSGLGVDFLKGFANSRNCMTWYKQTLQNIRSGNCFAINNSDAFKNCSGDLLTTPASLGITAAGPTLEAVFEKLAQKLMEACGEAHCQKQ